MNTPDRSAADRYAGSPWRLDHAVRILAAGGLLSHPTEGVWGLACDPLDPAAVLHLLAAKRRAPDKGLILIAHTADALTPFLDGEPPAMARESWPGPVTWLLPAAIGVPDWLTGGRTTLAVRVTDHPLAAALCRAWGGPLVSTSANRTGHPAALHCWQVRAALRDHVDLFLAGDLQQPGQPSHIRNGAGHTIRGSGNG